MAEEQPAGDNFSEAELEQMLAPIALYPDSLLTHILIAATYPLELVQADRWVSENPDIEPSDALQRVESKTWDPSVKALVAFPTVLDRLSHDLEWTRNLGDAFLQDEEQLLASVQSLRLKAEKAGNLKNLENMEVVHEEENIIIQPIEREVIYVPYYDTRVVYGTWHWAHYPPIYWGLNNHRHYFHDSYYNRHYGVFSWYPRVRISTNFFFGLCNWRNRNVVVIDHHHSYLNNYHDRRSHRRYLIKGGHGKRWHHNSNHRRGVAYRTNSRTNTRTNSRINDRTSNRSNRRANNSTRNLQQHPLRNKKRTERKIKGRRQDNSITTRTRHSREREVKQRLRSGTQRRNALTTRNRENSAQNKTLQRKTDTRRKHTGKRRESPRTQKLLSGQKTAKRPAEKTARSNKKTTTTKKTVRSQQKTRQRPVKTRRKPAESRSSKNTQRAQKGNSARRNNARRGNRNNQRNIS